MLGPDVKLVGGGRKTEYRPKIDLDAFVDPPLNYRAMLVRNEGKGRWLVRTGFANFFFDGSQPHCVKAGMKPIQSHQVGHDDTRLRALL